MTSNAGVTAPTLMRGSTVVDGLALGAPSETFLDDLKRGNVNAINWTLAIEPDGMKKALMAMLGVRWLVRHAPDKALIAKSVADICEARDTNRVAFIQGWQGTSPLEGDYYALEIFWEYGLRIVQLCYNHENALGYGSLEPRDSGLKRFGIEVVRRCNELGMLVDCSHTGTRTTLEAIAVSSKPCVISHSNPRAIHDNPRNISDDEARACAEGGGVVGVLVCSSFLVDQTGGRRATLNDWVRCVDYLADLIGIDHVGIGTDLAARTASPINWSQTALSRYPEVNHGATFETREVEGVRSHADFPLLVAALIERGYSNEDVAKIIGGNWLRVYRAAWQQS